MEKSTYIRWNHEVGWPSYVAVNLLLQRQWIHIRWFGSHQGILILSFVRNSISETKGGMERCYLEKLFEAELSAPSHVQLDE